MPLCNAVLTLGEQVACSTQAASLADCGTVFTPPHVNTVMVLMLAGTMTPLCLAKQPCQTCWMHHGCGSRRATSSTPLHHTPSCCECWAAVGAAEHCGLDTGMLPCTRADGCHSTRMHQPCKTPAGKPCPVYMRKVWWSYCRNHCMLAVSCVQRRYQQMCGGGWVCWLHGK